MKQETGLWCYRLNELINSCQDIAQGPEKEMLSTQSARLEYLQSVPPKSVIPELQEITNRIVEISLNSLPLTLNRDPGLFMRLFMEINELISDSIASETFSLPYESVVDAFASVANTIRDTELLKQIFDIQAGLLSSSNQDKLLQSINENPASPWRILILNSAIVATRSHHPDSIGAAYENVLKYLPEIAPDFFREAMLQMDKIGYPHSVREVVQSYFDKYCLHKSLH